MNGVIAEAEELGSMAMEKEELDPSLPHCQFLLSAIQAMEPFGMLNLPCKSVWRRFSYRASSTVYLESLPFHTCTADFHAPYLRNFLKKLITQVEFDHGYVLDQLYELYAQYITSFKDDSSGKRDARICKRISFLFPDECSELQSCPHSKVLVFPLQCSLNMLEGDTGCSIWPSSLFLSALILSHPELFSNKMCFEIGSGVGLVGLCLAHVKASKVILSDGDISTLANMKFNLELNNLIVETDTLQRNKDTSMVKCLYLPWESASESQLRDIMPDVVLGADVIYDPVYLPHLVRLLAILLNRKNLDSFRQHTSCEGMSPKSKHENGGCKTVNNIDGCNGQSKEAPVAYIACVIRNIETFNYFLSLGDQANLDIMDLTDSLKPVNLLRYMQSYNQDDIKLLRITSSHSGKIRLA